MGDDIVLDRLQIKQLINKNGDQFEYGTDDILPSIVWLADDNHAYTGIYCEKANAILANKKGSHIVKSIKRDIGSDTWQLKIKNITYNPTTISALLLKTIYQSLMKIVLLNDTKNIVVTIPASFSSKMRRATIEAAIRAGFDQDKLLLLDEPVAALFSKWDNRSNSFNNIATDVPIMIFDMGGGTIDVTILTIQESCKKIKILATSRYNEVAGEDIDLEIASLILNKIRKHELYNNYFESSDEEIVENLKSGIVTLQNLASEIKYRLNNEIDNNSGALINTIEYYKKNTINKYEFDLKNIFPNLEPNRIVFEIWELLECIAPLISGNVLSCGKCNDTRNILTPINQALESSNLTKHEINSVYLAGGCSKFMPVLCELRTIFPNRVSNILDPIYAVAEGAAKYSYLINNKEWETTEVTNEKIYLRRQGQPFLEILPDKLPIPCSDISPLIPLEGNDTYEMDSDTKNIYLEFYQGTSVGDPSMSLVHIENQKLQRILKKKSTVTEIKGSVYKNKIYSFAITFEDHDGKKTEISTIEFSTNLENSISNNYINSEIILNNERINL